MDLKEITDLLTKIDSEGSIIVSNDVHKLEFARHKKNQIGCALTAVMRGNNISLVSRFKVTHKLRNRKVFGVCI